MATLAERIVDAQNELVRLKDALTDHIKADDADENVTVELADKIEKQETALASLKRAEKALGTLTERQDPKTESRRPFATPAKKTAPGDLIIRSAVVQVLAHIERRSALDVLTGRYGEDDNIKAMLDITARAATAPANTTTPGWAAELVQTATLDFIDTLVANSIYPVLRDLGGRFTFGRNGVVSIPGFKTNAVGSVLKAIVPVFGGALASLFGTKTTVVGSGLYGGAQSLGSILDGGFDASYYSDVQKKKKLFGITTGTKYSTQLTGADAQLENQFTLILRGFSDAIGAAAGPLGASTNEIEQRLRGFVVDIGKIDLKDLTGEQIQEKLSAVFGAAADKMALAAFPGFERFQKVGEGAFETLVRVASTVESVSASLDLLGGSARTLGIDAKLGIAGQFESVSALSSAADAYFEAFYSKEEQAAAKTAQFARVFNGLGMAMPATLDGFRKLVEAQDLTTAAGQSTYATLLQLAPAFADLQSSMSGAKSAADILAERQDLERKILELNGDTAAIRALDLAKVDVSNRALQEQVWAIDDAQKAAQAAEQLANAWGSVGNSIDEEIRRIRGLSDGAGGNSFAAAFSAFNAATISARAGDQDAAKLLPSLSQALLKTAGDAATSRQELDRVQAQTAASLEQTSAVIAAIAKGNPLTNAGTVAASATAAQASAPSPASTAANDTASADLRDEIMKLRNDLTASLSAVASNTGRMASKLDDVTSASGGDAVSVTGARA